MIYRTSNCPYCGYQLEYMNSKAEDSIGPEYLPCPKCEKLYKTNITFWDKMTKTQKAYYLVSQHFLVFLACVLWLPLIFFIISSIIYYYLLNSEPNFVLIGCIYLPIGILAFINGHKNILKETKITFEESLLQHWKKYDSNCDSLLPKATLFLNSKGYLTFFEFEKEQHDKEFYEIIKYKKINSRINYALEKANLLHEFNDYKK